MPSTAIFLKRPCSAPSISILAMMMSVALKFCFSHAGTSTTGALMRSGMEAICDLHLEGWNKARAVLTTHSIGGLSENDFILANKINELDFTDALKKKKAKFWA